MSERLRARNPLVHDFFAREATRLCDAAELLARRFTRGGRLFAFGRGAYATDAAHVSVEFVHPVIVGKRALPALDASAAYDAMLEGLATPDDAAIGFGPPGGDPDVLRVLARARKRGLLTFAFPGPGTGASAGAEPARRQNARLRDSGEGEGEGEGENVCPDVAHYSVPSPSDDAHVHQELFEILGHTLYESVHVFLEHERYAGDAGEAGFLYPFLGEPRSGGEADRAAVARSIVAKASDGERLRDRVAEREAGAIASAARAIAASLDNGGRILAFGNGGSATDATDFALDCISPECGLRRIPALTLAAEPAVLTAVGNDVGMELTFLRQVIAHGRSGDVALAFSTSGGSKNVVAALEGARGRGMITVALLGYDGGEIARGGLADHTIVVDCADIPRIQETQAAIYHVLREAIERARDGA